MSNPIDEIFTTAEKSDETSSLIEPEMADVNSADSSQSTVTSEVVPQIGAATDPLSKQLELLYDLMKDL